MSPSPDARADRRYALAMIAALVVGTSGSTGQAGDATKKDAGIDCGDAGCGSIVVGVNFCPMIAIFVVSPGRARAGELVQLEATASDINGDSIAFTWSASEGAISDPNAAKTSYRCTGAGTPTLRIAISDGQCGASDETQIACDP